MDQWQIYMLACVKIIQMKMQEIKSSQTLQYLEEHRTEAEAKAKSGKKKDELKMCQLMTYMHILKG